MREERPRRVAGNYFIQVGQGVFASVSTRTFHLGGVALACCLAQRSSASASAAGSSSFGGDGGANWLAYCTPPEEKALTNWISDAVLPPTVSTPVRCRAPPKARTPPIRTTMNPGQKSWRSNARIAGFTGGCGMRFMAKEAEAE